MGRVRFGIAVPQFFDDRGFDPAAFGAYMARADALGFDSAWTQEQTLGTMGMLGPLEAMTYAAACTGRIRLGCTVFVLPLHSPVHLAKSLSTLDQMSRGRLEVGVGSGGRFRMFSAFGVDSGSFIARFTESLELMKALWTQPKVSFKGRFFQLEGASMEPKPFQKPYPPIWFGASHPRALQRAVAHGNGFFGAGSTTTSDFAKQVPVVRQALTEAGRDPASFRIAKRLYIAVDDDLERARQRVADGLAKMYSSSGRTDMHRVAVYGPPAVCVEAVREVIDAGAQLVLFTPLFDAGEQMERLAGEVIPQLEDAQ
jgi:probable F420-dependent oxidoreductase